MSKLQYVFLNDNRIEQISSTQQLQSMKIIRTLNLFGNPFCELAAVRGQLKSTINGITVVNIVGKGEKPAHSNSSVYFTFYIFSVDFASSGSMFHGRLVLFKFYLNFLVPKQEGKITKIFKIVSPNDSKTRKY
ncbi:hypothetical protein GQX74_013891 [Glossina fuscipes]|nr:hypothetical protein GQX74_013891 [Glossina fuscipes]